MKISIVIVHWNNHYLLKKSLLSIGYNKNVEIIVVDSNSRKKPNWVKKDFPWVKLILNSINVAYPKACNQGAVIATGGWLLFLNEDLEITYSQITKMIRFAIDNHFDAISPNPGSIDYRKPLPSTCIPLLIEFTPLNRIISLKLFRESTLFGGTVLIKSYVFMKLNGWDERFFSWFDDTDLTLRLVKSGYKVGWCDKVVVKHVGGKSFKKYPSQSRADIFFHSMDVFAKKHFSIFGQFMIALLKKRMSGRKVLPELFNGVSLTVPNLKKELLKKFFDINLTSIKKNCELIVVTSALKDEVWEWRKKYPFVRFITIDINKGVASTINIGFRASTGKWIGTVNDDVVLNNKWISECLKCAYNKVGSLNPVIFNGKDELESAGVKVFKNGRARPIKLFDKSTKCFETDAANGAVILYSKEALNNTGLFDERFGSYLEDIDLSLRMKKIGYRNVVVTHATAIHIGHQTAKDLGIIKQYLDFRNWFYVIAKNWSTKDLLLNLPIIVIERFRNLSGIIKSMR